MTKVLHCIPSVSLLRGGPSHAIVEMVKALRDSAEVDAEILTTNDNADGGVLDVPLQSRTEWNGVPVYFFSRYSSSLRVLTEFQFSWSWTKWLQKHIHDYDLLHVHAIFSYTSTAAMAIARKEGVPYVVRPLGQLSPWSLGQSKLRKLAYLKCIERKNLEGAKAIHFTTEMEREEAKGFCVFSSAIVAPHGVELVGDFDKKKAREELCKELEIPSSSKILLFLSRLHPKKELELLIEAAEVAGRKLPLVLLIAGSGDADYEEKLVRLVREKRLEEKIRFLGFLEGEKKEMLLRGADNFILCSNAENFGVAVVEAMARKTPPIISSEMALAKTIEEEKLGWVSLLEASKISETILATFEVSEREKKERENKVQEFVRKKFSWETIAREWAERYQKFSIAE